MTTTMKRIRLRLLPGIVLWTLMQSVQADCPLDGTTLMNTGPISPQTTFPLWLQDSEGLAVEMCPGTDQVNCISLPPNDPLGGNTATPEQLAFAAQIGFGNEAFWASADALIDLPNNDRALLVSAVEAAFLTNFAPGGGTQFTRLRIRIDVAVPGTYVITHPWGQITEVVDTPGQNAINISDDLFFVADQVGFNGSIGPILTWDTFPNDPLLDLYGPPFTYGPPYGGSGPDGVADYIGTINFLNPITGGSEHFVKGSPCGTNEFKISAYADPGLTTPINIAVPNGLCSAGLVGTACVTDANCDTTPGQGDGICHLFTASICTAGLTGNACITNADCNTQGAQDGICVTNTVKTDLFNVTGKIFNGPPLPTPLAVDQATYSRAIGGRVNVFATAPTQAAVSFTGDPNLPAGSQSMPGDGSGRFFGSVPLTPDATTVPAEITVTADNGAFDPSNVPTDIVVPLVDLVTITRAEYDYDNKVLTIEAHSSDLASPPILTALGQTLSGGVLATNLAVAPPTVTVTSDAGGSATRPVTVNHAP